MGFLDNIRIGTTGLKGHQTRLDVIGNNISNVGTTGFKRSNLTFQETYQNELKAAVDAPGNSTTLNPYQVGYGLTSPVVNLDITEGNYKETGRLLDLAVKDNGFFIMDYEGKQFYTRDGGLALDARKNLVQKSTGAYMKGWTARLEPDGTTSIDVNRPLDRMLFDSLQTLPARPTSSVSFASNLGKDTRTRSLTTNGSSGNLVDANGRILTLTDQWTDLGNNKYLYEVSHDGEVKLQANLQMDNRGNLRSWKVLDEENFSIVPNSEGQPEHITFTYPSANVVGKIDQLPITITLPHKRTPQSVLKNGVNTGVTDYIISTELRLDRPGSNTFGAAQTGSIKSRYAPGAEHPTFVRLVDDQGEGHDATIVFEHLDTKTNKWQFRTYLSRSNRLIQDYVNNPVNNVKNPARPTLEELEAANEYVFGDSRIGTLVFGADGFPDFQHPDSNIPTLSGYPANPEPKVVGQVPLSDVTNTISKNMEILVRPVGDKFIYELQLPATSPEIIAKAEAQGLNPENLNSAQLQDLNQQIFGTSNSGTLVLDQNGQIDAQNSHFGRIQGTLSDSVINTNVPASTFAGVVGSLTKERPPNTGAFQVNYDMKLVSGFGGEFSTAVRASDGYEEGLLLGTSITSTGDGLLEGSYTNGQKRTLGQIGLTIFNNASGLVKEGANLFRLSANVGFDENSIGAPNDETRGLVYSGYLETSNVDISHEFTDLIVTQRVYQANSKSITTSDSILQTAINLKS